MFCMLRKLFILCFMYRVDTWHTVTHGYICGPGNLKVVQGKNYFLSNGYFY